jgi:hypothetical protein
VTRRALAGFVLAAALLAGCGLPDDSQPRIISAADAPLDLGEDPSAATTTPAGNDTVELFFVSDGLLHPVMRTAPDGDLATAIQLLLAGPARNEFNLSSSIQPDTELNSATVDGTTAVLDLGCVGDAPVDQCGILGVSGQDQKTLFAQLVCTAGDVPGVDGVRFLQDGNPQDAPTDGGTLQFPAAVTCGDYRSLRA